VEQASVAADRSDRIIREWESTRRPGATGADPDLEAVRTAVLLEDAVGVVLSDEQITPACLGDPAAVRALLADLDEVD
jgi:hypothetical protein